MDHKNISLPIHSALIPVFYKNFHCLAQECKDSCCEGWSIQFNKKDYLRLRRLDAPPALRERLDRGVRRVKDKTPDSKAYGNFDLVGNGGRCPFLDPDGLCAIQRACGHDALPHVCTTYPRHINYSPAAKEYSLSPSCEGVLQQLWDLPNGVEFVEDPLPKSEHRIVNVVQGESLMLYFTPIRSLFIDILQDRALSLTERMLYLGITIQRLQKEDWTSLDPDRWVHQTVSLADTSKIKEMITNILGDRGMFLFQNLKVLSKISLLQEDWTTEVFDALEVKQKTEVIPAKNSEADMKAQFRTIFSQKAYEDALAQFQTAFSGKEYFFENLMVASALYMNFPTLTSHEALWKSYVDLCNLYSLYRFTSVLGCRQSATKERLFHMIVMVSRATLHSQSIFRGFRDDLFQHDSSTLAHMAILLNG